LLVDEVPAYELRLGAPVVLKHDQAHQRHSLRELLASPNARSKRYAYRQYDSTVQANTVFGPGQAAAAVVRVEGTRKALAITTDCDPRAMQLDPRRGAMQAVAEAARNLACVGATPIAVTDCLNFGNPEKPLVAWQLSEAVAGLADACRAFEAPIVSGNVSLYNESAGRAIPPTPTVGMVGLLEDASLAVGIAFSTGATLVLLGEAGFALEREVALCDTLRTLIGQRLLLSAQDVSEGGLALAVAECCFAGGVGARLRADMDLSGSESGQAVVSCASENVARVLAVAEQFGLAAEVVGEAGGERLLGDRVEELKSIWEGD
jgi:phosphoribosylformylglycinamidine synthase